MKNGLCLCGELLQVAREHGEHLDLNGQRFIVGSFLRNQADLGGDTLSGQLFMEMVDQERDHRRVSIFESGYFGASEEKGKGFSD